MVNKIIVEGLRPYAGRETPDAWIRCKLRLLRTHALITKITGTHLSLAKTKSFPVSDTDRCDSRSAGRQSNPRHSRVRRPQRLAGWMGLGSRDSP